MLKRSVKPGDGHPLPRFRWWQLFSRSVFHLGLVSPDGSRQTWTVDVRHGGDSNGIVLAKLYRDGVHEATSKLPAKFIVPGGRIEVVVSGFGIKRCHYVTQDGAERQLAPDPASAEGRRARLDRTHPVVSRTMGTMSLIILVVALVLGVPQIIDETSHIPPIADNIGTFTSPVRLPAWANISLVVATLLASTERALRLRYNWVLDGGLFDGGE
ncbi:MAG: hypothetical protein Q7T17_10575 [Microbacterium sp.]|uniref:hypothetical protein n=1 Tax=Microbacterium sp. TaxID=51671 RepID=UPI0027208C32|nr:hypothetical protein [Microbacterium sp.]MDO8383408.1 hypothetical protein [Microbacterium sp.]